MDAYTEMQLIAKAEKHALMSTEELITFNREVREALMNGAFGQDQRSLLIDAYARTTERINSIKQGHADLSKQREEEKRQQRLDAQKVHPREQFAQIKNECMEKLKNQALPQERREELERELNIANNALRGWENIDAEQQRTADTQRQINDARLARDRAAELGVL